MGADLYIKSISDASQRKYEPEWRKWINARDKAKTEEESKRCQQEAVKYFDLMYPEDGYFRDSYNASNLLWQFDLSWWRDIGPMLDENGYLSMPKIRALRDTVAPKGVPNPPKDVDKWDEDADTVYKYFVDKKERFLRFLDKAIELNEPIFCSI